MIKFNKRIFQIIFIALFVIGILIISGNYQESIGYTVNGSAIPTSGNHPNWSNFLLNPNYYCINHGWDYDGDKVLGRREQNADVKRLMKENYKTDELSKQFSYFFHQRN